MKRINHFLTVLILLGVGTTLWGQNATIRGKVKDRDNLQPLPGANVVIIDMEPFTGTTTNEAGEFVISHLKPGRVSIRVSYVGYQESVISNLQLSNAKEVVLDVNLTEAIISGDVIEIVAQRDKRGTINPMATISSRGFTVEETGRYAGSRNDVARMAMNYAGVTGANDARNDIIVRGNSPLGLLWRLEDVDIHNPNHYGSSTATGGPVCMLNNNLLANSDFMTSAFAAEYGNATAAVFDLKLRNGNDKKHEFLGQIGFNGFEFGAEGPINKETGASYLANVRYSTLEIMDKLGADLGTGTGIPKYKDFTIKVNLPATKLGDFSIFAFGGDSDIKIWDSKADTTKESIDFYGGEGYDLTNGSKLISGGITHSIGLTKNSYLKTTIASSYHNFKTTIDSLSPDYSNKTTTYKNNFNESFITLQSYISSKLSARSQIKGGFRLKQQLFDLTESIWFNEDQALRPTTAFDGNALLAQAYIQWQYRLTDHFTLNNGLHSLYYAYNDTWNIEPRMALKWGINDRLSLSLGYGYHSQLNPITVYFRQTLMPDGTYSQLNKNLDLLKAHHFVLGGDYLIAENTRIKAEGYIQLLSGAGVNGGVSNYYSLLNEGANFGFGFPDTLVATGKGRNIGIELTLEQFLHKGFYYLGTLSLFDSKYKGSDNIERSTAFNTNYVANLLIGKEFILSRKENGTSTHSLAIDIKGTWSGGQRYTPSQIINDPNKPGYFMRKYDNTNAYELQYPDYLRTDFKIVWKWEGKGIRQEFGVDIQNIFNQQNVYSEKFNKKTGKSGYVYQTGILVIPQYRINF